MPESVWSNGYELRADQDQLGELVPTSPESSEEEIRRRFQQHGYLLVRDLLPRSEVLEIRRFIFGLFADTGLLAEGSDPVEGRYAGKGEDKRAVQKAVMTAVRTARFEAFCLHGRILSLLEGILGGPPYLHKRKILRHNRPGDANSTGAHYDLVYLRGGTDRVVSCWIPLGDVPVEMGGLLYLEGSDEVGRDLEAEFARMNADLSPEERISAFNKNMADNGWLTKDLVGLCERFGSRWLTTDYRAGDVVLHSSYMIHAAGVNADRQGRLRLSTDIRFQNLNDEIDARWSEHWTLSDML
jgi:ectoine hydroxylase-related dioxygenase (phytanoyl-CoA dioxygenase family)